MRIGFTGTREGMTTSQWMQVQDLMREHFWVTMPNEFHDGDCVGADSQAFHSALLMKNDLGLDVKTHGHPCNLHEKYRAGNKHDVTYPIYPPLVRNRHIVQQSDLMLAAPKEYEEVKIGSGTWATIRYAQRKGVRLIVVWPDGTFEDMRA
jgi:hypothetical protein